MKKSVIITVQLVIFAILATIGIIYILNRAPVEELEGYEFRENSNTRSSLNVERLYAPQESEEESADDLSLTGKSGRYDEVRIGKKADD